MDSERRKQGINKINELMNDADKKLIKGLGEVAPDLANYVLEFIFGDLYSRPGLDIKIKQIITITTLAVLGNAKPQLAYHIKCALNIGITRQEIVDLLTHISGYAGFPASLNGISIAKEVFENIDHADINKI